MLKRLRRFFIVKFQRKLLLFTVLLMSFTATLLSFFLIVNMRRISSFALEQNRESLRVTVKDYLNIYTNEKAASTELSLKAVRNNLSILGLTAQRILDNGAALLADANIFDLPLFQTALVQNEMTLSTAPGVKFEGVVPMFLKDNAAAKNLLQVSGLLNLNMDIIHDVEPGQALLYFVGDVATPVHRLYPNINLSGNAPGAVNAHFWESFFPQNVSSWRRWYADSDLQKQWSEPITVEAPYTDKAGNGTVMTMFYPLWNSLENKFAGAIGLDLSLDKTIQDLLSVRVAETGFAFLINSQGELIAMPDAAYQLLGVKHLEILHGGRTLRTGLLKDSKYPSVRRFALDIAEAKQGVQGLTLEHKRGQKNPIYLASFTSLSPLANNKYQSDTWKIGVMVPEAEILGIVQSTAQRITYNSNRVVIFSVLLLFALILFAVFVSVKFSQTATKDLRSLTLAAEQVSKKNYDIDLHIDSEDEMAHLGAIFTNMAKEIRQYTVQLEEKVAERTASLQEANNVIVQLNEQLKNENLRLGAELDVAKQLQMMVLPPEEELDMVKSLDIACYMQPADEVGGDYYDVLQVGDKVFLGVGDVTGHGLSSGVIMLMVQTAFLVLSRVLRDDLGEILIQLNKAIYHNILRIHEDKNMTLAFLLCQDGKFKISGQHESVIICRQDGTIEEIDTMELGFPVGMLDDIQDMIAVKDFSLDKNDVMLLYTDGVTEAEEPNGEQYDSERLKNALARHHELSAQEIKDNIIADLFEFISGNTIYDDISMVVVKQK